MSSGIRSTYRRLLYGEPVIVISGLPRSGTSMAMKMLEAAGMPVVQDGVRTADEDNPKGYYEDERVKDLGNATDKGWLKDARGRVVKIISYLLKDLPEEHNYKVIFLRRDLEEVLASQKKMLERRGEVDGTPDEKMIEIYKDHLWKVNYLFKHKPQFEVLDLEYKAVVSDPRAQARRMSEFLGQSFDIEKMAGVVDAELYRNRRTA